MNQVNVINWNIVAKCHLPVVAGEILDSFFWNLLKFNIGSWSPPQFTITAMEASASWALIDKMTDDGDNCELS